MLSEFERVTFKCVFQDAIIGREKKNLSKVISKLKPQIESNYLTAGRNTESICSPA